MKKLSLELDKNPLMMGMHGTKILKGKDGDNGKSAYEIWLEQGNEGTEEDFIESLKGETYEPTEEDLEAIAERAAEKVQKPDIPEGMASEDWVNANFQPKGKYVTDEELEEKLKDVSPEGYATEEWTNENFQPKGNYLEEIPAEYVTETELEAKGYQTKTEADGTYQPKGSYATTEQLSATEKKIPTKNSQLENDSGYLKSYTETDPTVPYWAKQANKPTYTKKEVGLGNVANERQYSANNPPPYPVTSVNGRTGAVEVEEKGAAQTKVTNHNADDEAHTDIRLLIAGLTARFNAFMDSTDEDLDQASEFVEYIKANRSLIESITTTKVNVADIIDNLTTSVSNKPLSAKQGVQLKALIDAIKVPTALSQLTDDSTHRTVTDSEKAAWDAKSDFSGEYADLKNKPTKVTDFTNDAGYQTAQQVQNYAQPKGNYITEADLQEATNDALEQAKNSGAFDGVDGQRGFSILKVTTAPSSYTTATGGFTPTYRIALSTVKTQSKATEVLVGDTLAYSYYQYPIGYVDSSYVYLGTRTSIRGATGAAYTLTEADKTELVQMVLAALPSAEQWTFELEDGTTVVKEVFADDI